jgi:hypothetical protein
MGGGAEVSNSRHEAIRWIFCLLGKPMEQSNGMVEQAIDHIIKAAVDEMKATNKESLTVEATTEESSADQKEVKG